MHVCPSTLIGDEPVTLSEGLQLLVNEHEPLRNYLQNLYSLCKDAETAQEQKATFQQLIEEVTAFEKSLSFHSSREEEHLFAMMEKYIGRSSGPLAVMDYEHEQAHGFIDKFLENTQSPEKLSEDDFKKHIALIRNAHDTLLEHFAKEEAVLYPMAEKLFTDEEKELLKEKVSVTEK